MAKQGVDPLKVVGAVLVGALLLYLVGGRGKNNSLLIPDSIEDRIDWLISVLNDAFGHQWVNLGLDALQTHIEQAMPQLASLVNAVYWVEKQSRTYLLTGTAKKAAVLRAA
ncbi:MAG TPA: hypothetical protein VFQ39_14500 [Longimicrobium sp.]|nr:hypothetical protein [Longimicrobium sp.]